MIFRPRFCIVLLLVALCTCTLGCQIFQKKTVLEAPAVTGQPVDYYLSPEFPRLRPSRIVLMIPKMRNNSYEVQTKFADALHRQLNEKGVFEVILKTGYCDIELDSIRRGTFDERHLLNITREFTADGIMFCEVSSFSAYEPLQLGCSLTFVDMRESIVTLHTNGFWNTNETHVAKKFLQDVCKIHRCKQYAANVYLRSPTEFMDFVARDLTEFLQSAIYQSAGQVQSLPSDGTIYQ